MTDDRIEQRAALIEKFRTAILAAVWEEIERTDPELLQSDDEMPYSDYWDDDRPTELQRMASTATDAAAGALRNWL